METKSVLNRTQRKALDVILKKRKQSVINSITDETGEIWRQAQQNLQWIVGEPVRLPEGVKVDFSMFDFIVATTKFLPDDMTSDLKMLQRFWITIYPHVDKVIENLNHYKLKFREIYGVEGQTLKNYALQNLELQCYKKFFNEELHKHLRYNPQGQEIGYPEELAQDIREAFNDYHKKFKDESDAKIAEMKKKEEEIMAKQQKEVEEREKIKRQQALQAKLSI